MESVFQQIKFTDTDVVNPSDFIPAGEFNPHKVRPWLLHDHGFCLAVVFASCEQDALDEAADAGKLDRYRVQEADLGDYAESGTDGKTDVETAHERLAHLGNACEPFDIESMGIIELPNPSFSFCALFNGGR